MYRAAWHVGLKTTYYLRSLGASNIEKATVGVKKEMRGAVGEGASGGQNSGDAGGSHSVAQVKAYAAASRFDITAAFPDGSDVTQVPFPMGARPSPITSAPSSAPDKRVYTAAEKNACSIEAMRNGGECEACQ